MSLRCHCDLPSNSNEDKTQQKIVDIQKDIAENQDKSAKLQNDLKQMDVDARTLLDEHKQAMVFVCQLLIFICKFCCHGYFDFTTFPGGTSC